MIQFKKIHLINEIKLKPCERIQNCVEVKKYNVSKRSLLKNEMLSTRNRLINVANVNSFDN